MMSNLIFPERTPSLRRVRSLRSPWNLSVVKEGTQRAASCKRREFVCGLMCEKRRYADLRIAKKIVQIVGI